MVFIGQKRTKTLTCLDSIEPKSRQNMKTHQEYESRLVKRSPSALLKTQRYEKWQSACPHQLKFLFLQYNLQMLSNKQTLAILLAVMLLVNPLHCIRWQGTGSMNNTVITEIWANLESNLDAALRANSAAAIQAFLKDISDRLSARWDPAWNIVMPAPLPQYDAIFYGYAFRNQWMWYNGVPSTASGNRLITLIVWKDYNCIDWKAIGVGQSETSSFTTDQKAFLSSEIGAMTENNIINDVWGTAHTLMTNLQSNQHFSSGGYSVIMFQDGSGSFFGRICRVGDSFYDSKVEMGGAIVDSVGRFYLFQTR